MPIFQTKIYRTRNKTNSIFFSPEFKKKIILFMSSEESNNPDFVDNLTKPQNPKTPKPLLIEILT